MNAQQYKTLLFKIIENERALGEAIASGDNDKKLYLLMEYKSIRKEACKNVGYNYL